MKINLTNKQYRTLMEQCYLANWVINAYRQQPDADSEHNQLLQYLFSFAEDFHYDGVEHDAKHGIHRWSEQFLQKNDHVTEFLRHYDFNRFADMFSDKMAEAALMEKYSPEDVEKMDPQKLSEEFLQLKQKALTDSRYFSGSEEEE